jgi:fumarate reductase flavoprotein subunit
VVAGKFTFHKRGKKHQAEDQQEKEGLITQRDFGGVSYWRCAYTADGTGHTLLYTMDNVAAKFGVKIHDRVEAVALIHDGQNCLGAVVRDLRDGSLRPYLAKATVIATGGFGRIYGKSTNAIQNEGTGCIIAQDTGLVPLGNMEAIQFHPTALVPVWILITEGCRGDGGYLLDRDNHRFMADYEPEKQELASRDVVSRRMIQHIRAGKGVEGPYGQHLWLDIRHLGRRHLETRLREVTDICRFNRLGGNSLAETLVTGWIAGTKLCDYIEKDFDAAFAPKLIEEAVRAQQARIDELIKGGGDENVYQLRKEMEDALLDNVHIFRNGPQLEKAVNELKDLHARSRKLKLESHGKWANPELSMALKLPGMIRLALSIAYGGLKRTESRGSHYREDFPARDDQNWLKRTLAYWKQPDDELPTLEYEAPVITESPPGSRGYGESQVIPAEGKK